MSHVHSMDASGMRRRAILDLCIAFAVAVLLLVLNVDINFSGTIHEFFGQYASLPAARWAVNILFFWLVALLWLAFFRWRRLWSCGG